MIIYTYICILAIFGTDEEKKNIVIMFDNKLIDELQKSHLTAFFIVTTTDTIGHKCQRHCYHTLATKEKNILFL
jgi:hypothetical protein